MRQALWILRKDIRRMRPRIAVVWLLMPAAAVVDSAAGRHPQLGGGSRLGISGISMAIRLVWQGLPGYTGQNIS